MKRAYVNNGRVGGHHTGLFAGGGLVPPIGRLCLVAGVLIALPDSFSCRLYLTGSASAPPLPQADRKALDAQNTTLSTLVSEIFASDRGRALLPTIRGMFTGQVEWGPSPRPPRRCTPVVRAALGVGLSALADSSRAGRLLCPEPYTYMSHG